jgi:guanosine-3',5'-bis(diphosphate) 3'-pyrophosphohydrolase
MPSTKANPTIRGLPQPLARAVESHADRLDVDLVLSAYELAKNAHSGQRRASGDDFISHAVEVATILSEIGPETDSIVAALVHDVVEDTAVSLADIEEKFGTGIATIVDGVTKIGRIEFRSHTEKQVENYRKLLLSIVKDVRVIVVKLADRLHNMRTLDALNQVKQRRIALETREIYAPLAHRLGMATIKWELEDLAFKYLEPNAYKSLGKKIKQRRKERELQILEMKVPLDQAFVEAGVPAQITGRPKHLWSIYKKMEHRGLSFEDIYDLMALRVLTDTVQNCYVGLGLIHNLWNPIQGRFHDFIATPKSNKYRSIHTTVVGPFGRRYEIQIRSEDMHHTAVYGIAAHWRYKESMVDRNDKKFNEADEALTWFRQVLEWQKDTQEPNEFMEFLHMDLFQDEIFIFTPKGELKVMPTGATPIDFAYSVHSEIGQHCSGAMVNGKVSPLSQELKNGDTVEIVTRSKQCPSRDWLGFVKTSRARGHIRHWIRQEEHESSLKLGRGIFEREVRKSSKVNPTSNQIDKAYRSLGYDDFDQLLSALGHGDVSPISFIHALYPNEDPEEIVNRPVSTLERIADRIRRSNKGVNIQEMGNLLVRYSKCCQPLPGDNVIGYLTRGRGVSIHCTDCSNILKLSEERRVDIELNASKGESFFVDLHMDCTDRIGLLTDVAKAIGDVGTNIKQSTMKSSEIGVFGEFSVEVESLAHLKRVLKSIRDVEGVKKVNRPGSSLGSTKID